MLRIGLARTPSQLVDGNFLGQKTKLGAIPPISAETFVQIIAQVGAVRDRPTLLENRSSREGGVLTAHVEHVHQLSGEKSAVSQLNSAAETWVSHSTPILSDDTVGVPSKCSDKFISYPILSHDV